MEVGVGILGLVMVFIIVLGRYALSEGQRIESQKKFMKNMNEFDLNRIKNDKK
tara:strand:+ start:1652 stop:1810 length:159 start_codon:yes stop_codon:yes gene_type:complete